MKKIKYILFFLLLSILLQGAVYGSQESVFTLTDQEKELLKRHPQIHIGILNDWLPMNFTDKDGEPKGIGVDYIDALNKRLNNFLIIKPGTFQENFEKVKNRQLDAMMDITPKKEREPFFNFTRPYLIIPHVIVGRRDGTYFHSEKDLAGKSVALERGFYNIRYFKENYPDVIIKEYSSTSDALDAVSRGEADAYAGNRTAAMYLIEKELLVNLKVHGRMNQPPVELTIGVRKDLPDIAELLNKTMTSISQDEIRGIHRKWLEEYGSQDSEQTGFVSLTHEERKWLAEHPVIRVVADPDRAPLEFIDKRGEFSGISADYLERFSEMLGVKFRFVKKNDTPDKAGTDEPDIFSAMNKTSFSSSSNHPELKREFRFTSPYLSLPIVIFTRNDVSYISSPEVLKGKKVAVVAGYSEAEFIEKDYPEIELVRAVNIGDALRMLAAKTVFAYIGSLLDTGYYIEQAGYTNLKVSGETSYRYEIAMAVKSDFPLLADILQKTMDTLQKSEHDAIYQKWMPIRYEHGFDYSLLWKLLAPAVIFFCILAYWNRRLSKEIKNRKEIEKSLQDVMDVLDMRVQERTKELENLNQQLHEEIANRKLAEDKLKKSYDELEIIVEKRTHELIEANKRLQELDKLKSMFIASMSHELRTPLNSIIGFTGMLLQGISGDLNEEQKDDLSRVYKAGKHLLSLITDVIDISKIEAGRVETFPEQFFLKEIIDEAVMTVTPQLNEKKLSIKISANSFPSVVTDKKRLLQCILNFLSNAVKYTEKGGIVISVDETENNVEIAVSDTGIGIAQTDMPKLFEAFERIESHLKVKAGGTGLGLYLTKKIAEQLLCGSVSAESNVGKGSTFKIRISKVHELLMIC